MTDIIRLLHQWTAVKWMIAPTETTGGRTLDEREQDQKQTEITAISSHPLVAATLERFNGATVTSITPLDGLEPAPSETDDSEIDSLETDHGSICDDNQGGPLMRNLASMMQKAKEVQKRLAELKEELADQRFHVSAGGGAVEVEADGKGNLLNSNYRLIMLG